MPIPLSILVVDDDRDNAESLSDLLNLTGFRSRFALSGAEAEREGFDPPDVVILDLWMPVMGGWELASRYQRAAKLPIIIIATVSEREEDFERARETGVHRYLVKPINLLDLIGTLDRIADQRELDEK
jgi:CheY-like chemotaxis protein